MTEREMMRKKAAARKARQERERKARNRRVVVTVALMLVVCIASIGGTIAWLTDSTEAVTNTFSPTDINITLTETKQSDDSDLEANESWTADLVPGMTYTKNPVVTVKGGSEKCWLFVKVEKENDPDDYLDYSLTMGPSENYVGLNGWIYLEETNEGDAVFARVVDASDSDQPWNLITDNIVKVKTTVIKPVAEGETVPAGYVEMPTDQPSISFTAYAIQYSSFEMSDSDSLQHSSRAATAKSVWNDNFAAFGTFN